MTRRRRSRVGSRGPRAATWSWLKRYRVWDANRKIFVYPENWLEPDPAEPRSRGVRILLAGKDKAGAVAFAGVLARALRIDLYRVDLGSVVTKYIGETEKNLSRLFAAAEKRGALLLFDEADALFGGRSGIKDGHDRHANIEVNYFLRRLERYKGRAILATGRRRRFDKAFRRRFDLVI
jgi:SpoVK/Ycf46/Vps4 family AAA+-type ATPase